MTRALLRRHGWQWSILLCLGSLSLAQGLPASPPLNRSGHITVEGQLAAYLIRHLPVSSFPALPGGVQAELAHRGCMIPQTYEAHQPENVIRGSFQRPGSSDWAVLCSAEGNVSLLVFFGADAGQPFVLASAPETERLQLNIATGVYGFNWGIDAATPEDVHEAQIGLSPRPPLVGHDAIADSVIDHRTEYHFYAKGAWTLLDMPEE